MVVGDYENKPSEPAKDYEEEVSKPKKLYVRSSSEPLKDYNFGVARSPVAEYGGAAEPPKDYDDPPQIPRPSTEPGKDYLYSEIVKKRNASLDLPPVSQWAPAWTDIYESDRSSIGSRSSDGRPPDPPEYETRPNKRSRSAQNRRILQHPRLEIPKRRNEMQPLPRLSSLPNAKGFSSGSVDGVPPTPPLSAGLVYPRISQSSSEPFHIRRVASQPLGHDIDDGSPTMRLDMSETSSFMSANIDPRIPPQSAGLVFPRIGESPFEPIHIRRATSQPLGPDRQLQPDISEPLNNFTAFPPTVVLPRISQTPGEPCVIRHPVTQPMVYASESRVEPGPLNVSGQSSSVSGRNEGAILSPKEYARSFHDSCSAPGESSSGKAPGSEISGQRSSVDVPRPSDDDVEKKASISKESLDHYYTQYDTSRKAEKTCLCLPSYIKPWMIAVFVVSIIIIVVLAIVLPVTLA